MEAPWRDLPLAADRLGCGLHRRDHRVLLVHHGVHFIPAAIACVALGALIDAAQGCFQVRHAGRHSSGWRLPCCNAGRSAFADFLEALIRLHSETVFRRRHARTSARAPVVQVALDCKLQI
jgi:hypothetical protein